MCVIAKCRHCQQLGPRFEADVSLPPSDMTDLARRVHFKLSVLHALHQPSSFNTDCWLWFACAKMAVAACWMICVRASSLDALA